jgi:hypothetical protein
MLIPARTDDHGCVWLEEDGHQWEPSDQQISLRVGWLEKTGEAVVKGTVNGRTKWCVQGLKGIKPTTAMMINGKIDVKKAEDFTDERVIQAEIGNRRW